MYLQGEAHNAVQIAAILANTRYYGVDTYERAINELVTRGWIEKTGSCCIPTNKGIETLARVARKMNNSFYAPWFVLSEGETDRLKGCLESLAKVLKTRKPKYGAGYAQVNRTIGWGTIQWARDKMR